jgi:hypothetical protein
VFSEKNTEPGGEKMTGKIREVLNGMLRCFESGDIPKAIEIAERAEAA